MRNGSRQRSSVEASNGQPPLIGGKGEKKLRAAAAKSGQPCASLTEQGKLSGVLLHHLSYLQQVDYTEFAFAAQRWLPEWITAEKGEAIS
jgi:hypothetical protein